MADRENFPGDNKQVFSARQQRAQQAIVSIARLRISAAKDPDIDPNLLSTESHLAMISPHLAELVPDQPPPVEK